MAEPQAGVFHTASMLEQILAELKKLNENLNPPYEKAVAKAKVKVINNLPKVEQR